MKAIDVIRRDVAILATVKSDDRAITGPIGYMIGAGYSLLCASQLGYRPSRAGEASYAAELRRIGWAVASSRPDEFGRVPDQRRWLARLHFNSGLHRIAAAADRLSVHPEPRSVRLVREEVNRLKHDIKQKPNQRGRAVLDYRSVSMRVAASALRALTRRCAKTGLVVTT